MHVLILNQTFHPDVAATAQFMWDLARHLDEHGHQVTVLASRQIYGTDRLIDRKFEQVGRITIHRVKGTAFGRKGLFARLSDFGSFYLAATIKLFRLPRPDVILVLTSPPMIAALATLRKKICFSSPRPRMVYYVMDLYPDAATVGGVFKPGSMVERILRRITRWTLNASDAVIALGQDMKNRIIHNYNFQNRAEDIHIIQPWADGQALKPMNRGDIPLAGKMNLSGGFNIVYSGNLGLAHDVDTMIQAIEIMKNDAGVRWIFLGGGKRFQTLQDKAREAGWSNVWFHGYMDRDRLGQSLNLADVHLVSQLPAFTGVVVPSKLFGILAVGKPTIMIGPAETECSRIVSEHGAGFVVANGQADMLVQRLRQLREDETLRREMGLRARQAFEKFYDRPVACGRIQTILAGREGQ